VSERSGKGSWLAAALAATLCLATPTPTRAADATDFDRAWEQKDRAIVIDAYEYNPIDWRALTSDKRIVGFINKASDGVSPPYACDGTETEQRLCKALWKRHAVARELFHTRRAMAKALGLKWGAYHLGRPGNPIEQANHFIDFAEPEPDDLLAIDIEDNLPDQFMSLADAEEFARHVFRRLGRYPVLYTNGSTAKHIADKRRTYPLLSRLPLWYARYKPQIDMHFPKGNWESYALWQFASRSNCGPRRCPYRVPGAPLDIDVNVAPMTAAALADAWPFASLVPERADVFATDTVPVPAARAAALDGTFSVPFVPLDRPLTPAFLAAMLREAGDRQARAIEQPALKTASLRIGPAAVDPGLMRGIGEVAQGLGRGLAGAAGSAGRMLDRFWPKAPDADAADEAPRKEYSQALVGGVPTTP